MLASRPLVSVHRMEPPHLSGNYSASDPTFTMPLVRMVFRWTNPKDDELIDLAFNKKRADDRKADLRFLVSLSHTSGTHI